MTKHFYILIPFLLLLFILSCDENEDISTYIVSSKSFENIIVIDGLVEPVRSTNTVCPRGGSGGAIAFLVEDGTFVEEGDVVCILKNKNFEDWYDQLITGLETSKAGLEKAKADLSMQYALLEAQVRTNEAETQIAHLDSVQLAYYSPKQKKIRELELQQVAVNKAKYSKKLAALTIIQDSELKKLELEIQRTTNHANATKIDLDALTFKATKRGLAIRSMNNETGKKLEVGDNVWMNMAMVEIPSMDKMKVKMMAAETDYRYINVNDSVYYSFDAMPNNLAFGKITNKMPVGKEIKQGSKVKFFEIEASIDSVEVMPEPGFTVNCNIILKQVRDTIAIPQIAVFDQDSMKVVYVENKGKGYEMRQVEIAESSPKEAVVTRGLLINEVIALRKPSESSVKKTVKLPKADNDKPEETAESNNEGNNAESTEPTNGESQDNEPAK